MTVRELPARPNLAQYKKQAKELVKAAKRGATHALALIREHHPRWKSASDDELRRSKLALADAQLIVARQQGFESWPKFARHLGSLTGDQPRRIFERAEKVVVRGDAEALDALLARHGDILHKGPVPSSWWGGLAPRYSDGDARAIIAREHDFESWDQFAAFSEARKDPASPVAKFEAAADAIVFGDIATLKRQLRSNPSLIRARSTRTHQSTLLHYVGANGVEGFRQRTPKNVVKIAEVLLDAGADINAKAAIYGGSDTLALVATSGHPVTAGVQEELIALLLARGASPGSWSKLINACHANGRRAGAELLGRRAEALDLEAAAGLGRLDIVQRFFDPDGQLIAGATRKQMQDGFAWACEYGHKGVVEFLLRRGMEVAAKLPPHRQTGLHWAAHGGHLEIVRLLLRHGARVDPRDETFEGTPLDWALHGWVRHEKTAAGDRYHAVVKLLVAAGATFFKEGLDQRASPIAKKIRQDASMRMALGLDR